MSWLPPYATLPADKGDTMRRPTPHLTVKRLATLYTLFVLAGLAAAVLAFLGYGRRLREYR